MFSPSRAQGPLSRALLPAYVGRPFPRMTVVTGYFDDSRNGNIVAIAGYMSALDHWDGMFAPTWAAFVDDPSWPSPMGEFKTADCRGGYGKFASWPREERDRCFRRAVEIIGTSFPAGDIFGIGIALELPQSWDQGIRERFLFFAYMTCLGHVINNVLHLCEYALIDPKSEIQFILDDQPKWKGDAWEMFEGAVRLAGRDPQDFEKPMFRNSERLPPLQAADLLAYETSKEVKKRRDDPSQKVRGALEALELVSKPSLGRLRGKSSSLQRGGDAHRADG